MIINSGGIEYTKLKIKDFSKKAIDELECFKDSKYKNLLIDTVTFNLNRNH